MESNRIHIADKIEVRIIDPDGKEIATLEGKGFRTVDDAVTSAVNTELGSRHDPRDYTYLVRNLDTGTEERYRINAHSHLQLVV